MTDPSAPNVAIVGGGPAGLMAADVAAKAGARVTVFERMPSAGRKFLLAGRGGLNLTHSEDLDRFLKRYGRAEPALRAAIEAFSPAALRTWCEDLGQSTFVGTSGRVFPAALKTSPLLRAWLRRLDASGVSLRTRHAWTGWDADGRLTFSTPNGPAVVAADAAVLALGGASWPHLGSDGAWVNTFAPAGVKIVPLRPANCGFAVAWSDHVKTRFAGHPLKRLELAFGTTRVRGEAVITEAGIEGGGIYALSSLLRESLATSGEAVLHIDLRPDLDREDIAKRLAGPRGKQSGATFLRKTLSLSPAAIGLLHETSPAPVSALAPEALAAFIKSVPLRLAGPFPITRAISTAGGIDFGEIDETFMLRRLPGTFVAGEMIDWEAPTGGYLLQATFATGAAAGRNAVQWANTRRQP